jgi:peptidoglycan/LPS O-acetylase OafA/YrhL
MRFSDGRPRRFAMPHAPALDGLRGLAVAAVVLYHAGLSWATGGFLGVELFFVLSGFLITSLLLAEWRQTGRIAVGAFWSGRARRLLPALLAMVSVVGLYYALAGPQQSIPGLRGDGLSTLLYAGNWHQISVGSSYFAATGPVSPLQHTWSLAIEEQFYVFWPLIVIGLTTLARRRTRTDAARKRALRLLLAVVLLGVLASVIDTAILYHGGRGIDRVYYGTDTRAFSLLLGAALACWRTLRSWRPAGAPRSGVRLALSARGRRVLDIAMVAIVVALGYICTRATGTSGWLYPYGLLAVDLAGVALISGVLTRPDSPVGRLLAAAPVRWLGQISYGLYLWHFPLFQWLDQSATGLSGTPLLFLRLGTALGASVVSYFVIEQPIRRGVLPRWTVRSLTPIAAASAVTCVFVGSGLSAVSFSAAAAKSLPLPAAALRGQQGPCPQSLIDAGGYGLAPLPAASAARTEFRALGGQRLSWHGSATVTFDTCPPGRALVVGDSLAYTVGVGLMENEQRYGMIVGNAARLGCAFNTTGQLLVSGTWESLQPGCADKLAVWARDAQAIGAGAVIVELGYRDQFDWRSSSAGPVEHLGQRAFDRRILGQIERAIEVLGAGGTRKVLFLSVPWSKPPDNPDGSIPVAASPARHNAINRLLVQAATSHPNVAVLDIDRIISPSRRYQGTVNGQICRFDGIHFTLYCSELLQPAVLGEVRSLLAH